MEKVLNIIRRNCPAIVVDVNSSFAEIGVDSLSFIKIIVDLEQEFVLNLRRMLSFLAFPTVKAMINYVTNKTQKE